MHEAGKQVLDWCLMLHIVQMVSFRCTLLVAGYGMVPQPHVHGLLPCLQAGCVSMPDGCVSRLWLQVLMVACLLAWPCRPAADVSRPVLLMCWRLCAHTAAAATSCPVSALCSTITRGTHWY